MKWTMAYIYILQASSEIPIKTNCSKRPRHSIMNGKKSHQTVMKRSSRTGMQGLWNRSEYRFPLFLSSSRLPFDFFSSASSFALFFLLFVYFPFAFVLHNFLDSPKGLFLFAPPAKQTGPRHPFSVLFVLPRLLLLFLLLCCCFLQRFSIATVFGP